MAVHAAGQYQSNSVWVGNGPSVASDEAKP